VSNPAHTKIVRQIHGAVLTISDTRTIVTDQSGQLIRKLAEQTGVLIADSSICKDSIHDIRTILKRWLHNPAIDVIVTTGGSGIAKRDVTIEAVKPLLEKEIEGFGECFRWLGFTEDAGTRAIASRALAGIVYNKLIFVLPGSVQAIKLAMTRLILPELNHLVYEVTKHLDCRE